MDINFENSELLGSLPYNLEAEQSVLGAMLLAPETVIRVMEYLKPDNFFREQHKAIFSVILSMFTTGRPIDFVTVLEEVAKDKIFESPDRAKLYLAQVMELVPSTSNVEDYCIIVQEKFYIRSLILASNDIIEASKEEQGSAKDLLDMAEQRIYDIRQGRDSTGLTPISDVIVEAYDHLQKLASEDKDQYLGLSTGYSYLDTTLTGLNKSDLILLAARPGMGKTSFAMNVAVNVAKHYDKQVAIFTLEMSNEQVATRVLSSEAMVSSGNLKTGTLSADEWVSLATAADKLCRTQMFLDDSPGITVAEMKAKLRRMKNLGLVVIDYLQLMSTGRKDGNRVLEISEITRNLKIMAKELNVPIITLSQLSRGPDARQDKRPMLSDLRESGSIEQDADIVMFLYREDYYNEETDQRNIAECIVAKNRHGETNKIQLGWDGAHTLFRSIDQQHYSDD